MVEIRTFAGDMKELSEFCHGNWRRHYLGRTPFPLWSPEFLEWELADGPATREYQVAAYDGARLVGFLGARPMKFHFRDQVIDGTWGSFFSVDTDYENQPIGLKLNLEQRRRHRERGARVNMGFIYTPRGKDFWLRQPKFIKLVRRLGLWVRPLDARAIAAFSLSRWEALGARFGGLILGRPSPPRDCARIRPFVPVDAASCAELLDAVSRRSDLGYAWDETLARRQLGFDSATRTLVAEHDGRIAGLINYFPLELMGKAPLTAGVIDFFATQGMSGFQARDLVRAALQDMCGRGMHIAMALRISSMPSWPLILSGFAAMPRDYHYVAQPIDFELPDWRLRRLQVHWR